MKLYKNKEWLYQKYVVDNIPMQQLANDLGVCTDTIYKWLDKFEIPRKTKRGTFYYCANCGKKVWRTPSELKENKNIFCSLNCCNEYRNIHIDSNPTYKEDNSKFCDYCNKPIRVDISKQKRNKHYFCSKECFSKWQKKNLVGENASNYKNALNIYVCEKCGKSFMSYHKNRKYCSTTCKNNSLTNRIDLTCDYCKNKYMIPKSQYDWHQNRGYVHNFCSQKCKSDFYTGLNHPNYIEDRSMLKDEEHTERQSTKMKEWRETVFLRDKYTCQICGNKSSKGNPIVLNAHHIKKFKDYPELRYDVHNGITLCASCHKLTYKKEELFENLFFDIVRQNR